jgi:hypothetical protein
MICNQIERTPRKADRESNSLKLQQIQRNKGRKTQEKTTKLQEKLKTLIKQEINPQNIDSGKGDGEIPASADNLLAHEDHALELDPEDQKTPPEIWHRGDGESHRVA